MIPLKTPAEIESIRRAGVIIGRLFEVLPEHIRPGTTTAAIDRFVEDFIRSHEGATPAFKGLYGFPASTCISVNEEVVHGIPRPDRTLRDGDIVSIDVGVLLDGWYADAARTFPVGEITPEAQRLLDVTEAAMYEGIRMAKAGNRLGDIGAAVQRTAESAGFGVVRDLVGHGIGRQMHEDPQVPNFGRPGQGLRLRTGLVICIEPMITAGSPEVLTLDDRWTVVTQDGGLSAHFEHTVAVLADGPRILTAA